MYNLFYFIFLCQIREPMCYLYSKSFYSLYRFLFNLWFACSLGLRTCRWFCLIGPLSNFVCTAAAILWLFSATTYTWKYLDLLAHLSHRPYLFLFNFIFSWCFLGGLSCYWRYFLFHSLRDAGGCVCLDVYRVGQLVPYASFVFLQHTMLYVFSRPSCVCGRDSSCGHFVWCRFAYAGRRRCITPSSIACNVYAPLLYVWVGLVLWTLCTVPPLFTLADAAASLRHAHSYRLQCLCAAFYFSAQ